MRAQDAGLDRFVTAQAGCYLAALAELRAGSKRSHWMWFMFPQLTGLGQSETARFFGISGLAEATAYLAHPRLGPRLDDLSVAMLDWADRRTAAAILGEIDALKLCSSMTLFEAAGSNPVFAAVLDAFYAGRRDERTLQRIA